jgi:hypothetical protein
MTPPPPVRAADPYGPDGPGQSAAPRRAVEVGTLVIMAAAIIAVGASSWPLVWDRLEGEQPIAARRGLERVLRENGWAVGPPDARKPHRVFSPDAMRNFPFDEERGGVPRSPHAKQAPADLTGALARPRTIVQLLDRGDPDGTPVLTAGPDDTLMIVRESGPWLLCALKRENRVEFGWATREQVTVIP